MYTIRALYIGDVRYSESPVFEFNKEEGVFEMLGDKEFRYPVEDILEDDDWMVFEIRHRGNIEDGEVRYIGRSELRDILRV